MDSGRGKIRMNVEGDRLSSLPDDLILKILSFIGTKQAIRTSVLSSRWRYIWTSTPCLDFSTRDFRTLDKFYKFVTGVLSSRKSQIDVSSLELDLLRKASQSFFKRSLNKILNYALSHNVQQLNITCWKGCESRLSRFSSQSLEHLTLIGLSYKHSITTPPTWDMQALTTLTLFGVTLYADNTGESAGLFSNCANLKNLSLSFCKMGSGRFNICHPRLCNLTLERSNEGEKGDVAPQLKNLTIKYWTGIHLISSPNLTSLQYEDYFFPLEVSADLPHLEKVDICIHHCNDRADAHGIVCMLQKLHSVKFLTLNLEIIKILCSYVELISHQPSPFANLKSLEIYPKIHPDSEQTQPKVTTEVKNYFVDGSPGATFTMFSHDDIRAMKKTKLAQNLLQLYRRC
ncbi:putative F-box/LRR-repeat protein At3g28410 [Helianthus annuus]|uniref:putative F-box/LRR-repeat protein At3g28410 n=1 Tax=Helianthus annuus TaxID=4232 RepID=UPI000B8F6AB9|nr:putative F-box/LRR-repeat protein At3g28410 [Helianthus annuus]XP_035842543.1 putative F-box/LRR-repeat protein At3g28410 [Helianthus annuus]